ncbi:MAG: hypothetical protein KAS22_01110 [Candidatus Heimdallarchaeota archaeon]|nr:hypothetical protein [Candidatus Heimdallarchaeota archaeon]
MTTVNKKGTFLVRSTKPHRLGIQVVNQEIKRLGKVVDVIGPVAAPYIVINTRDAQAQTKKGDIVYLLDKPPQKSKRPQQSRSGKPRYSKKSYSKK